MNAPANATTHAADHPLAATKNKASSIIVFLALLFAGVTYGGYALIGDLSASGADLNAWWPFVLLVVALLIALGFEFVNGFHDTANAVATVIYTHSLKPNVAVVWSGIFNFLGVLTSSGAVAFGILSLLPVELILQVGSHSGFAMVFALLLSAIVWNLFTWWLGLPASSSHTLIGSIVGVGIANAMMHGRDGTSGVDWDQVTKVGYSLLLSPLIGFICAALLLIIVRKLVKSPELYAAPKGNKPPPWWIRSLLVVTCTGVSFAHGSNDGQKGMGLIMLILVGTVPMAYSLNRAMPAEQSAAFVAIAEVTQRDLIQFAPQPAPADPQATLSDFIRTKTVTEALIPSLGAVIGEIANQVKPYANLAQIPSGMVANVRNEMYLASETIRVLNKSSVQLPDQAKINLKALQKEMDDATKFIPLWVKVVVAIALGLGTMVGWKRIVVTVGEKIGKTHLTYAQGASAETVAMCTIGAADGFGLPVSTTQVLSSGVAGTMAASGTGLQMNTLRSLMLAWVLTLPAAMILSASLYWLLQQAF